MRRAIVRAELLQLRDRLRAATSGRDLLDRKREALVRAIVDRDARLAERRRAATEQLREARASLVRAQLALGRARVDAASAAQPPAIDVHVAAVTIVGVRAPRALAYDAAFAPQYGDASGSSALTQAGRAFVAAIGPLAALAADETAVQRLRLALARTARRLNALDQQVIPEIQRDIRQIGASLEEEERDDAVRRKLWLAKQD